MQQNYDSMKNIVQNGSRVQVGLWFMDSLVCICIVIEQCHDPESNKMKLILLSALF